MERLPRPTAGVRTVCALVGDLTERRLAPRLLRAGYLAVLIGASLLAVAAIGATAWASLWWGLLALLLVPVLWLGVVSAARISAELALAVLRMADRVDGIAVELTQMASTVDEVAGVMPRLGFLRRRTGSRDT